MSSAKGKSKANAKVPQVKVQTVKNKASPPQGKKTPVVTTNKALVAQGKSKPQKVVVNSTKLSKTPVVRERGRLAPDYGQRLGATIGEGAQTLMEILGFGDYKIKRNSLMGCIDTGTSPPTVHNKHRGEGTVIHHREYLGELYTGGTALEFSLQEYAINIGNPTLFPFGETLSQHFQEWEVNGMVVELKSEASQYTDSVTLGAMFAAVDYNGLDPAPTSKVELENMEYAVSCKLSDSIIMPIECARTNSVNTHLYVCHNNDYQGGDKRLYDLGTLYVGTQGTTAVDTPIAEIWISYEITLYKPIIGSFNQPDTLFIENNMTANSQNGYPPWWPNISAEMRVWDPAGLLLYDPDNSPDFIDSSYLYFKPERVNGKRFLCVLYFVGDSAIAASNNGLIVDITGGEVLTNCWPSSSDPIARDHGQGNASVGQTNTDRMVSYIITFYGSEDKSDRTLSSTFYGITSSGVNSRAQFIMVKMNDDAPFSTPGVALHDARRAMIRTMNERQAKERKLLKAAKELKKEGLSDQTSELKQEVEQFVRCSDGSNNRKSTSFGSTMNSHPEQRARF